MSDMSWQAALIWMCIGALLAMLVINLVKIAVLRRKINKRVGLPAPACQRFPDWTSATARMTERELPMFMRRNGD